METENPGRRAEETASRLIAQRDTGPWSAQDAIRLEQWLAEATLHRVAYARMNAIWREAGRLTALKDSEMIKMPEMARAAPPAGFRPAQRSWRMRLALAAGVALVVVAPLLGFRESLFRLDRYSTAVGSLEAVQLADGSRVTLNTDSALRLHLTAQERHVDLEKGEAFFDVARDSSRPFVVEAGGKRVVVVGTRFCVQREGADIRVSVTDGAVRVEPAGGARSVILRAGAVAQTKNDHFAVTEAPIPELEQRLSWRSGVLTFNHTPLSEAVEEINRYNQRKIVILDPAIAGIRVGGTFEATKIDPFLRLLKDGFPVSVSQEGEQVVIAAK